MTSPPRLYPTDLSDAEWAILEPLIPAVKLGGRPSKWTRRAILDGIIYVVRSGCQWRLLPREFPPWKTVYHYFRVWRIDGTWERLNATLRERERVRQGRDPDDDRPWHHFWHGCAELGTSRGALSRGAHGLIGGGSEVMSENVSCAAPSTRGGQPN